MEITKLINFLLVGLGGFIGSMARYGVSLVLTHRGILPFHTLTVNVIGGLIIGCLFSCFSKNGMVGSPLFLLLVVGVCGGFTTFSTFSLELFNMVKDGNNSIALLYILLSVVLSLIGTVMGYYLIKFIL